MEMDSAGFRRGIDQANAAARNFGQGLQAQTRGVSSSFGQMEQSTRGSLRALSAGLAPISPQLSAITREASFAKTHVAALGAVAATAAVALIGVGVALTTKVIAAGKQLETDMARLDAVIKTTGSSAGLTATQIREFADELANQTLADAPAVRAAATKLLTFRNIAGDTFTETLVLAQDLAAVGFGSIETASVQLGKALEDPVAGVSALKEAGISFSAAQREMIKDLVQSNRLFEAQAIVLQQVRVQVQCAAPKGGRIEPPLASCCAPTRRRAPADVGVRDHRGRHALDPGRLWSAVLTRSRLQEIVVADVLTLTTGDLWDDASGEAIPFPLEVEQRVLATKIRPLRAIRLKCGACMGGPLGQMPLGGVADAVDSCASCLCPLWPFRFGTDPFRAEVSDEHRERARRLTAIRLARRNDADVARSSGNASDGPDGTGAA